MDCCLVFFVSFWSDSGLLAVLDRPCCFLDLLTILLVGSAAFERSDLVVMVSLVLRGGEEERDDEVAQREGLLLCPEGAATYAAYKQEIASGRVSPRETAVLFNCASGLKYELPPVTRRLDATGLGPLADLARPPPRRGEKRPGNRALAMRPCWRDS